MAVESDINKIKEPKYIEALELKYLEKLYHFLKFVEEEMRYGFQTKETIKEDWIKEWQDNPEESKGISSFSTGAERIVYSLINHHGFGQPNSAPIGSDLFFETKDAFIHIDLKTIQTRNIGDYNESIPVGKNQNSYDGIMEKRGKPPEEYHSHLPKIYRNSCDGIPKPCLSYFIAILYEEDTLDILCLTIMCMPNGILEFLYGSAPLKAGKNPGKARFHFSEVPYFAFFSKESRIKVVLFDEGMKPDYMKKMGFIKKIYDSQK